MKLLTLTTLVTLSGLAAAQVSAIPQCALPCLEKAIQDTTCGLNTYCQCTTGSKVIQAATIKCLCSTNACSAQELLKMQDATNNACSSALAASSQTYTAATLPANACQTGGGSTGTASSNAGKTTGTGTGTGTGTAAAATGSTSSSAASSSSGTGAAPTNAAMLGYQCAALGLAGMALFGL